MIKRKVFKRRINKRYETEKSIPELSKSKTLVKQSTSSFKIVKGKFSEISLQLKIDQKRQDLIRSKANRNQERHSLKQSSCK